MALARKEDFSRRENDVADFAKSLAHPARLAILMTLAKKKECICGELVVDLPLSQSTVSQHLKALKEVGLIKGVIDGPRSRYCVDWKVFETHQREFNKWSEKMIKLRIASKFSC
jgi:ArsR family transcriptional regulator, arsenate/arsenite/antimonite-responsive transcriptional repressor